MYLNVKNYQVKVSNLNKTLWPETGYIKKDLIDYYIKIYPLIKNYLKNRPIALKVYPDGIKGKSFYQKNCPDHAPDWLSTVSITHKNRQIEWITINKLADLVWLANYTSIELHCWFSTAENLNNPDFAVFDLDPTSQGTFSDVIKVAQLIKKTMDELNLISLIKTSGKRGLHIFIPVSNEYNYNQIKNFLKNIADILQKIRSHLITTRWRKNKRKGKIHIDYRQNGKGKTIPAPYSLRPTPEATISTPINWKELNKNLKPDNFTLNNISNKIKENKNINWKNILKYKQNLPGNLI